MGHYLTLSAEWRELTHCSASQSIKRIRFYPPIPFPFLFPLPLRTQLWSWWQLAIEGAAGGVLQGLCQHLTAACMYPVPSRHSTLALSSPNSLISSLPWSHLSQQPKQDLSIRILLWSSTQKNTNFNSSLSSGRP